MLLLSAVNGNIEQYLTTKQEQERGMALEQTVPQDLITNAKAAVDGMTTLLSASGAMPTVLKGLTMISGPLGIAGALAGLVFPLIGV